MIRFVPDSRGETRVRRRVSLWCCAVLVCGAGAVPQEGAGEESGEKATFLDDVLPVLSKAGCSGSRCHSKPQGQNGFKLSVFAYDPQADYFAIVSGVRGRRVFPAVPEESLILKKPTLALPHEGGQRFEPGSEPYRILLDWIRGGMPYSSPDDTPLESIALSLEGNPPFRPNDQARVRVEAHYAGGRRRDVTAWSDFSSTNEPVAEVDGEGRVTVGSRSGETVIIARFLGQVDTARLTAPAATRLPAERYAALPRAGFVDDLVYDRLQELGLFPSDPAGDEVFLRRVTLDLVGRLPTADEARVFLTDGSESKRARWIDALLQEPGYADYWAGKWADLLRSNPDRVGVKSVYVIDQWLRDCFRRNEPYDRMARAVLEARGSTHRDGPTVVYRDRREPEDLATLVSQIFLGTRLECARCHHHPNEKWSQQDFFQLAACFGSIERRGTGVSPPISGSPEFVFHGKGRPVRHPVTQEELSPRPPDGPALTVEEGGDPRSALADWMTAPSNPFFGRAAVNRVWAELMGRGFVEPVDDLRVTNPPGNQALLDALARDFAEKGYDFKHLLRTIANSRVYQASSEANAWNVGDTENHARSLRRRLPAEVLADAVAKVTDVPDQFQGLPEGVRALETWNFKIDSNLLDAFGRPDSSSDCPCERNRGSSVVQALHLMNSEELQAKLTHPEGRVARLAASGLPVEAIVEELYLTAFSRFPNEHERDVCRQAFARESQSPREAAEDILWALVNSAEFVFNH
ncbi:MAG TPA: DUF1549 and DUF1553 domain-containing protein [Verrucomicrobiales bacterium]|nr:DUF1549 and DUF1553 domain-containing protein [Verrucomicrobiales bacterium]